MEFSIRWALRSSGFCNQVSSSRRSRQAPRINQLAGITPQFPQSVNLGHEADCVHALDEMITRRAKPGWAAMSSRVFTMLREFPQNALKNDKFKETVSLCESKLEINSSARRYLGYSLAPSLIQWSSCLGQPAHDFSAASERLELCLD
jgi:hypothetical protein